MSNGLLYDPLLAHYLAAELDARLRGRECAAAPTFHRDRYASLALDQGEALELDLHPERGWIRIVPGAEGVDELGAECLGVEAPADERVLIVRLRARSSFRPEERRVIVELATNQWNALLADADDRLLSVLWTRRSGERSLQSGEVYRPLPLPRRYGAGAVDGSEAAVEWARWIGESPPAERRGALLRHFAYTGTPNAEAILGEAAVGDDVGALEAAFERWWRLRSLPPAEPVLLEIGRRRLPYPHPLPGMASRPIGSLLEGMQTVAEARETGPSEAAPLEAAVRRRIEAVQRRIDRLRQEQLGGPDPDVLRGFGDLLLARAHQVPRGADRVTLEGWSGEMVEVALDPRLSAAENAQRYYEEARRRARAASKLPELIHAAETELHRWESAVDAAAAGELPEWAEKAIARSPDPGSGGGADEPSAPYRVYRTSGGLEVRVGRNAKDNDRLTFGHSRPNDVWLHARSVPGSHVVLRWPDSEGAPPARDLSEAATLAALYSRARSSGLVAVDWTRRKYVRKPRGAPPGTVIPQQVKTVFVEPDPGIEERMRTNSEF